MTREKDVTINLAIMHATIIIGITEFLSRYPPEGQNAFIPADFAFWGLGLIAVLSGLRIFAIVVKYDYLPLLAKAFD